VYCYVAAVAAVAGVVVVVVVVVVVSVQKYCYPYALRNIYQLDSFL
jgi:hypothetical protein